MTCGWIVCLLLVSSPQAQPSRVELGSSGMVPPDSLLEMARSRPAALREELSEVIRGSARAPEAARAEALLRARALAEAYATVWRDSFLLRQVALFASWSPGRQAARFVADSLRRAGVEAYGARGPGVARAIWSRAFVKARAIPDTALMGAVAGNIGAALLAESRLDRAEAWLGRAIRLARASGDLRVEANALGALGGVAEDRGDLAGARQRYREASAMRERIGDTRGLAADRNNLGLLAEAVGDLDEAARQFDAALAINRRDGRDDAAATNLVNLAGVAAVTGDFATAEQRYRDALALWRKQGQDAETASALHGLGQLELRRGDYPAGRDLLREALAVYRRTGPATMVVAVQRDLAGALAAMGDLQGARDELSWEGQGDGLPVAVRAGLALSRADLATELNDHAEAERLYGESGRLYRQAGDVEGAAEASHGLGRLLLERGDASQAQALLRAALRTQLSSGNRRAAGVTRLSLSDVASRQGDSAQARRELQRAVADFDAVGDAVASAAGRGELAAMDLATGNAQVAISGFAGALVMLRGRTAPDVVWRLHAGLGEAQAALGQQAAAAREFRLAIEQVEQGGSSFRAETRRSQFLSDKWEVYARLAEVEAGRGLLGAAFDASERLRAREMLELLARGRITPPDSDSDLAGREQDLRRRIAELTAGIGQPGPGVSEVRGPRAAAVDGATLEALAGAEQAYQDLLVEMRERSPRAAALVSPHIAGWREVGRRLGAGEAMVEYLVGEAGSLAFLVRQDTVAVVDLGVGRRSLVRLVEFARGTLDPPGMDQPDTLWRGPLRQLHQYLIAPVEETGLLDGIQRLILVPHGELNYLPFAALMEPGLRGRFLIERYELASTPSASVWLALGDRPRTPGTGVLALAPEEGTLPGSRREVEAVTRLAGREGEALIGGEATENRFRRLAPDRRVVHLATNGVLNRRNPLFSHVALAPGEGQDGRLEVHEIFGLKLRADLVVLSACQTGLASGAAADVPPGDDWIGLTRAFLSAGAGEVVATLWPVDDWATAGLMEQFYRRLTTGDDPVTSLALAQRRLIADRTTAQPWYWAGFVVVGGAAVPVRPPGGGR